MSAESRFHCPSVWLVLGSLENRARRALWVGLGLAVCLHVFLAQVHGPAQENRAAKPLTTQFVKRQPRLTKPLELKKRPQPRHRAMRRRMVTVQARVSRQGRLSAIGPMAAVGGMARPRSSVGRATSFAAADVVPEALAEVVESTKEVKRAVDMSLEMVGMEALDTGQYHAMVIQDPRDKRDVRGFFHLAAAYSVNMRKTRYWQEGQSRIRFGLVRLVRTINRYTQIKADLRGTVEIDSQELLKTPWVWIYPIYSFALSASEADNLGKYMLTGGFLLADSSKLNINRRAAADQLVEDALAAQDKAFGTDWNYVRLPDSHPLYHCFFDFPAGPPTAGDWYVGGHVDHLNGIFFDNRLVCIRSLKNFENAWGDQGEGGSPASRGGYSHLDPERALQFGVNLVVFALTQEGSITHRIMDMVGH